MNERIKELAELAKVESSQWLGCKPATTMTYNELEKFAELIVEECADWINDNVGMIDEEERQYLLKHFGVKE